MTLDFIPAPDVLSAVTAHKQRPSLVIGFAAESEKLEVHARAKRLAKKCDWIVANDISAGVFGADENKVLLITAEDETAWPRMSKVAVAAALVERITSHFDASKSTTLKPIRKKL